MATTDARNRIRQPYRFYKPQFLDENRLKMDLDREFEDISQALLKVSEKFNMIDLNLDFDAGEVMDELNKIKSTIEVTIKRLGNLEEANSELSFKLTAQYNEMLGSLRHVNRVISNAQRALAEATLQLDAETISIQNDNARMSAHISRQDIVITDHEQAIARTNEKLDAAVETINNDIMASIETTKEAIATLEESVASVETSMNSKYDSLSKVVDGNKKEADGKIAGLDGRMVTAESNIKTVQKTSADNTKAISEMNTEMSSKFTSVNNSINSTNNTVTVNKKDADGKISNVNGRVDTIEGRVNVAEANIKTNAKTGADNKQAIASMETKMNAKFNEQEAKINTKAVTQFDHSGTGSATYEVNAGIKWNGKVTSAGMRIEASVSGGVMHSSVIFDADKFKIRNPSNNTFKTAFKVEGGNTYIESALIKNGSIDNAKIGNVIQSNNYVANKSGWMINKNGNAEFQNGTFRGTVYANSGSFKGKVEADSGYFKGRIEANDGYFKGTVYAEGISGDVCQAFFVNHEGDAGSYDKIIYSGGQPFDVDVSIVGLSFDISSDDYKGYVDIYIAGEKIFSTGWESPSTVCGKTIKAGTKNVEIVVDAHFTSGYSRLGSYLILVSRKVGGRFKLIK